MGCMLQNDDEEAHKVFGCCLLILRVELSLGPDEDRQSEIESRLPAYWVQ